MMRAHVCAVVSGLTVLVAGCSPENPGLEAKFARAQSGVVLPLQIAHAGGAIDGHTYSNSLEAFNQWYDCGCRWFEIDLDWTSDGRLAAIHDWNAAAGRVFGDEFNGCWLSREEFMKRPRCDHLTSIDDEALGEWLRRHPDAVVVTDFKWAGVDALALLTVVIPDVVSQVVPQIYSFDEYDAVRDLGFGDVILTLYRMTATNGEVLDFAENHRLLAVTMPKDRAFGSLPAQLAVVGVPSFAHTVNEVATFERLKARGIHGIYTDSLCGLPRVVVSEDD